MNDKYRIQNIGYSYKRIYVIIKMYYKLWIVINNVNIY